MSVQEAHQLHSSETEKYRERWVANPNLVTRWKNKPDSKFELGEELDSE